MSAPTRAQLGGALALAAAAISCAAIFFRLAAPTHPMVMSAARLALAAMAMAPWTLRALWRGQLTRAQLGWAVVAGALYAIHFGSWVWSLTLTSVAASVTLVTATPLMLALWGLISGRDRPTRRLWASLGLACVGIALVGWSDAQGSTRGSTSALLGDALALWGAAAMAVYFVLVRRLGPTLPVMAFSGVAVGAGALWLVAATLLMGLPLQVAGPTSWGYLALAALVPQLIGHNVMTWCLRHVTPTTVGVATLAEPVGATLLGVWWLGERVAPMVYVGCAVTLATVALALTERSPLRGSPKGVPS